MAYLLVILLSCYMRMLFLLNLQKINLNNEGILFLLSMFLCLEKITRYTQFKQKKVYLGSWFRGFSPWSLTPREKPHGGRCGEGRLSPHGSQEVERKAEQRSRERGRDLGTEIRLCHSDLPPPRTPQFFTSHAAVNSSVD